jgi:hypothetical protein
MATKLTRLTNKIEIQLYLVAESCTICSSRSRRPVRKLLDTPSYVIKKKEDFYTKFLQNAFGSKKDEVTEEEENCIMRSFIIYSLHQILLGWSNWVGWDVLDMQNIYITDKKRIQILVTESEGKRMFRSPRHRNKNNIKMVSNAVVCGHIYWIRLAQGRVKWRDL